MNSKNAPPGDSQINFLLIDDDPVYLAIMKRAAEIENINLDCYASLLELGSVGALSDYNVAIIDYDLGTMTGIEIAEYLGKVVSEVPTILVSETNRYESGTRWPAAIKRFVKKSDGYSEAIKAAIEVNKINNKSA